MEKSDGIPISVDDLAVLLEAKIRINRRASVRWIVGTAISLVGVSNYALYNQFDAKSDADLKQAIEQARSPARYEVPSRVVPVEEPINIPRNGRGLFSLSNQMSGLYQITATAVDDEDPVLAVYAINSNNRERFEIAFNDDIDNENTDSRVIVNIRSGHTYEVEVQEFYGDEGAVQLEIARVDQ